MKAVLAIRVVHGLQKVWHLLGTGIKDLIPPSSKSQQHDSLGCVGGAHPKTREQIVLSKKKKEGEGEEKMLTGVPQIITE